MKLDVMLLDEVSMIDKDCFEGVMQATSLADHTRRPDHRAADAFGCTHVVLFGDFKQLPPATSKAPFIVLPYVILNFEFRVLRQNRRVISGDADRQEELDRFHKVLYDISWGIASHDVLLFVVEAYVRGAATNCAEHTAFEGSTAVFTKRRYILGEYTYTYPHIHPICRLCWQANKIYKQSYKQKLYVSTPICWL